MNEVGNYKGPNSGGVSAFSIDHATGKLTFLNEVASRGADPCYITSTRRESMFWSRTTPAAAFAVFPVLADGKLGEASAFVQHTGHGPNAERQEGPHAHSIDLSADNRFAMVDDLGLDELLVYKFDAAKGTLTPNDPPFAKVDAGAGPRHFVLRPDGKFAYVVSRNGTHRHACFRMTPPTANCNRCRRSRLCPRISHGRNDDAEIQMHPSGKFPVRLQSRRRHHRRLCNRRSKGTLTQVASVPTGGKEPRSFEIDPTGKLLFAENQKSDNIVVFRIDQKTGQLTPTGKVLDVRAPVCVKFVAED